MIIPEKEVVYVCHNVLGSIHYLLLSEFTVEKMLVFTFFQRV